MNSGRWMRAPLPTRSRIRLGSGVASAATASLQSPSNTTRSERCKQFGCRADSGLGGLGIYYCARLVSRLLEKHFEKNATFSDGIPLLVTLTESASVGCRSRARAERCIGPRAPLRPDPFRALGSERIQSARQ